MYLMCDNDTATVVQVQVSQILDRTICSSGLDDYIIELKHRESYTYQKLLLGAVQGKLELLQYLHENDILTKQDLLKSSGIGPYDTAPLFHAVKHVVSHQELHVISWLQETYKFTVEDFLGIDMEKGICRDDKVLQWVLANYCNTEEEKDDSFDEMVFFSTMHTMVELNQPATLSTFLTHFKNQLYPKLVHTNNLKLFQIALSHGDNGIAVLTCLQEHFPLKMDNPIWGDVSPLALAWYQSWVDSKSKFCPMLRRILDLSTLEERQDFIAEEVAGMDVGLSQLILLKTLHRYLDCFDTPTVWQTLFEKAASKVYLETLKFVLDNYSMDRQHIFRNASQYIPLLRDADAMSYLRDRFWFTHLDFYLDDMKDACADPQVAKNLRNCFRLTKDSFFEIYDKQENVEYQISQIKCYLHIMPHDTVKEDMPFLCKLYSEVIRFLFNNLCPEKSQEVADYILLNVFPFAYDDEVVGKQIVECIHSFHQTQTPENIDWILSTKVPTEWKLPVLIQLYRNHHYDATKWLYQNWADGMDHDTIQVAHQLIEDNDIEALCKFREQFGLSWNHIYIDALRKRKWVTLRWFVTPDGKRRLNRLEFSANDIYDVVEVATEALEKDTDYIQVAKYIKDAFEQTPSLTVPMVNRFKGRIQELGSFFPEMFWTQHLNQNFKWVALHGSITDLQYICKFWICDKQGFKPTAIRTLAFCDDREIALFIINTFSVSKKDIQDYLVQQWCDRFKDDDDDGNIVDVMDSDDSTEDDMLKVRWDITAEDVDQVCTVFKQPELRSTLLKQYLKRHLCE